MRGEHRVTGLNKVHGYDSDSDSFPLSFCTNQIWLMIIEELQSLAKDISCTGAPPVICRFLFTSKITLSPSPLVQKRCKIGVFTWSVTLSRKKEGFMFEVSWS